MGNRVRFRRVPPHEVFEVAHVYPGGDFIVARSIKNRNILIPCSASAVYKLEQARLDDEKV